MRLLTAVVLTTGFLSLATTDYALAQTAMEFVDDPVNPRFFHGGVMWALFSIVGMATFGWMAKSSYVAAAAGLIPLGIGIGKGDFSPIVLVVLVGVSGTCTLTYIMFRR